MSVNKLVYESLQRIKILKPVSLKPYIMKADTESTYVGQI